MNTVKRILEVLGYDGPEDLDIGESTIIENEPYMDLVIERVSSAYISVMHPTTENGDTLRDPELVFNFEGESWKVIRFRDDVSGADFENTDGLQEFAEFSTVWSENLENQDFIDAAAQQADPDD